jgi:hypothetical protein
MRNKNGQIRRGWIGLLAIIAGLVLGMPRAAAAQRELLPDLVSLLPENIYVDKDTEGRTLIRFTQKVANIGEGAMRVIGRATPSGEIAGFQEILGDMGEVVRERPAASVIFHPQHDHWHAADVMSYELRQGAPGGPVAARNGKVGYCFVDDAPYDGYKGKRDPQRHFNCKTMRMGLSAGWVDIYRADLYDQWIDITDAPDGIYYLVVKVDPTNIYLESDRENNTAWLKMSFSKATKSLKILPEDAIAIYIDGVQHEYAVHPRLKNNRAMAPLEMAAALGAAVTFDGQKGVMRTMHQQIEITPGESQALVDGQSVEMGEAAFIDQGRLMVPVRFMAERMGVVPDYDWAKSAVQMKVRLP